MKHPFFNLYITNHFETDNLKFECLFDSRNFHDNKSIDVLTHMAHEKNGRQISHTSFFRQDGNEIDDISLLLSIAQGTHIFSEDRGLGRISSRKKDFALLLSDEIGDFINLSLFNLKKMKDKEKNIIRTAGLMFYQAKHLLYYDDLRDILMINCFEFLIGAIYRLDHKHEYENLKIAEAYKYLLTKFDYQEYVDKKLKSTIQPKKLAVFKKEMNVSSFASKADAIEQMRNWIAHGKQHKKPKIDSPSDSEFTFEYRIESFIRLILIDLIYKEDYKRKFDVLYQLILEMNVPITVTPDLPQLRFHPIRKS